MARQLTLGDLISKLKESNPGMTIKFDFCYFCPVSINSYRGYYDHLAIGYEQYKEVTVAQLLTLCEGAVGKTFEGYKGGDYKMSLSTPLWVDNYGEMTGTTITGVVDDEVVVTLVTGSEYAE